MFSRSSSFCGIIRKKFALLVKSNKNGGQHQGQRSKSFAKRKAVRQIDVREQKGKNEDIYSGTPFVYSPPGTFFTRGEYWPTK